MTGLCGTLRNQAIVSVPVLSGPGAPHAGPQGSEKCSDHRRLCVVSPMGYVNNSVALASGWATLQRINF